MHLLFAAVAAAAMGATAPAPLPIDLSMTVSLAWHPRTASAPAQLWFRSLLIDAVAER